MSNFFSSLPSLSGLAPAAVSAGSGAGAAPTPLAAAGMRMIPPLDSSDASSAVMPSGALSTGTGYAQHGRPSSSGARTSVTHAWPAESMEVGAAAASSFRESVASLPALRGLAPTGWNTGAGTSIPSPTLGGTYTSSAMLGVGSSYGSGGGAGGMNNFGGMPSNSVLPTTVSSLPLASATSILTGFSSGSAGSGYMASSANRPPSSPLTTSRRPPSGYDTSSASVPASSAASSAAAGDSFRLKSEQLRMLQEQNVHLLTNYERVEARASELTLRCDAAERENRDLRQQIMELTSLQRSDATQKQRLSSELQEREQQLQIVSHQNREVTQQMERLDTRIREADARLVALTTELDAARTTLNKTQAALAASEERGVLLSRENALKSQELGLTRSELDALRAQYAEMQRKTAADMDALQEALRVRKEKQYLLLEKTAAAEDAHRTKQEELSGVGETLRAANQRLADLSTRLAMEERARAAQAEATQAALADAEASRKTLSELQAEARMKDDSIERLDKEVRTSGDHVREMAQKVFAVLERLKLSELGKAKAIEALKARDHELSMLKKRLDNVGKNAVKESKHAASLEALVSSMREELKVRHEPVYSTTHAPAFAVALSLLHCAYHCLPTYANTRRASTGFERC